MNKNNTPEPPHKDNRHRLDNLDEAAPISRKLWVGLRQNLICKPKEQEFNLDFTEIGIGPDKYAVKGHFLIPKAKRDIAACFGMMSSKEMFLMKQDMNRETPLDIYYKALSVDGGDRYLGIITGDNDIVSARLILQKNSDLRPLRVEDIESADYIIDQLVMGGPFCQHVHR